MQEALGGIAPGGTGPPYDGTEVVRLLRGGGVVAQRRRTEHLPAAAHGPPTTVPGRHAGRVPHPHARRHRVAVRVTLFFISGSQPAGAAEPQAVAWRTGPAGHAGSEQMPRGEGGGGPLGSTGWPAGTTAPPR